MTTATRTTETALAALTTLEALREPGILETRALIEVAREVDATVPSVATLRLGLDDLVGEEGPLTGHRPLPNHARITSTLTSAGVTADTPVVVYAATPRDLSSAARAWLVLRWAGVHSVTFLNGAYADDVAALPRPAAATTPDATSLAAEFRIDESTVVDAEAVAGRAPDVVLIDARRADDFGDETQHIPGAINLPNAALSLSERVPDPVALASAYREHGVEPTAQPILLSCGGGVAASVQSLALASLGIDAPVYVGSWSEWEKLHL
ncbi:sulfurtransferase [Protaetiibacter larvae]|uniref:thiosulfate sulfurtransferase n=1 Tax=Protaetiibacter larvae TaxID=2592654 RepID=A0A5C1Y721_9MICO|nr:rhodanese-like domain-containing protein [Protaetiibacter larvae]QEO09450.1 hypothetical protein FLP23_05155 [Protaetiibacter larvae]